MAILDYPGDANTLRERYADAVEKEKKSIRKNFNDMDLDNSSVRNEIEDIIDKMEKECKSLISSLRGM